MRFDTSLQLFQGIKVLEIEDYKGFALRQGQEVALLFGAANRDPAQFDQPNRLDITRADNPHISSAWGFTTASARRWRGWNCKPPWPPLMRRLPDLRLTYTPEFRASYVIRGLRNLIVEVR